MTTQRQLVLSNAEGFVFFFFTSRQRGDLGMYNKLTN